MLPDVVYPVRAGDSNAELRYSLRSLINIPHRNVYITGYKPKWITNVQYIPRNQSGYTKYVNTTENLITACEHSQLSDDFILMNDDFFILEPLKELPVYNKGSLDDAIELYKQIKIDSIYIQGMIATKELMLSLGLKDLKSYELHVPMMLNKHKVLEMFKIQRDIEPGLEVVHKRSLYGNLYNIGGETIKDVKVIRGEQYDFETGLPFLSSLDDAFKYGHIGRHIRNLFTNPSQYERK